MILADEGFNGNLVRALREDGYEIVWIKETNAGMDDENIITLVKQNSQILITEDKDFAMPLTDSCKSTEPTELLVCSRAAEYA